ncbi:MAG TPA: hypothetical protein VHC22_12260 [Pirellulales bacterium]|nr:hypothetical protein [Pirellulales bacterium]
MGRSESLLAFVLTLVAVPSAFGQTPGLRDGPRYGLARTAHNRAVQDELDLSAEQIEGIDSLYEEIKVTDWTPEDVDKGVDMENLRERQKLRQESHEKGEKRLAAILSPRQFVRLNQIWLQQLGAFALRRADIAAQLELTDEQIQKIVKIERQSVKDRRTAAPREKVKTTEAAKAQMLAALTEEQQAKWKEMLGERFDLRFRPSPD